MFHRCYQQHHFFLSDANMRWPQYSYEFGFCIIKSLKSNTFMSVPILNNLNFLIMLINCFMLESNLLTGQLSDLVLFVIVAFLSIPMDHDSFH